MEIPSHAEFMYLVSLKTDRFYSLQVCSAANFRSTLAKVGAFDYPMTSLGLTGE